LHSCGTGIESWQEVSLLDDGNPLATMAGANDCNTAAGYELDSYVANAIQSPELHIIGVYEASMLPGTPRGEALIRIRRHSASTLVLSAYEPTRWTVRMEAGGRVDRVIATGYHRQEVVVEPADAGVETTTISYEDDQDMLGVGYSWPSESERHGQCEDFFSPEECEFLGEFWRYDLQHQIEELERLVAGAERITDRSLTTFHGCYDMSEFTLTETAVAAGQ